jgi:hypothetical protein
MFKRIFYWGISAGLLATLAGLIYNRVYFFATESDFSRLINAGSLVGANLLGCLLAAVGYWSITKWMKKRGELLFNLLFSILSFASIVIPISISLPLDIKQPELFPGLSIPMHFFPAIAWYTIRPVFVPGWDKEDKLRSPR